MTKVIKQRTHTLNITVVSATAISIKVATRIVHNSLVGNICWDYSAKVKVKKVTKPKVIKTSPVAKIESVPYDGEKFSNYLVKK